MSFNSIDVAGWKRRIWYEHYMESVRCTYSVTVNIEVEGLLKKIRSLGLKAYPVQIYMLASVVNAFKEFRMALDSSGDPGWWDSMNPSYAIFNRVTETFSSVHTPWDKDFAVFYENCARDINAFCNAATLFPQTDVPENVFTISSLPWMRFTGFTLNVYGEGAYLPPIFTIGRYVEQSGGRVMPLAIQVHHAVCDGYHVGRFVEALQGMATEPGTWL